MTLFVHATHARESDYVRSVRLDFAGHREPAVSRQVLAGHKSALITSMEERRLGGFFRVAYPADGMHAALSPFLRV